MGPPTGTGRQVPHAGGAEQRAGAQQRAGGQQRQSDDDGFEDGQHDAARASS
jgi:hypothetical protein